MKLDLSRSLASPDLVQLKKFATLLASAALVIPAMGTAADGPIRRADTLVENNLHFQPLDLHASAIEAFVQLDVPSVAEFNAASIESTGELASSDAQIAQAERVSAQQASVRASLEAVGAEVLSAQRVGANGLRVRVLPFRLNALRQIPGVRSVGRITLHTAKHVQSVPWVGAPTAWTNQGVRGKGVKVGVIDSGIDYLHANMGGAGVAAEYAANNRNIVEPGTFPTAKVKGGFDFAGPTYNAGSAANSTPIPDPDPLDRGGHGSHVAGSIAGVGVPGVIGPGVAPEADLYALKVFGDAGGSTSLTSLAIEWAMDPNGDGDMSDRLDVINLSLGGAFDEPTDPSAISAANAAAVGIVVVAASGNDGPIPYVTSAPAIAPDAISVAANIPGGRIYPKFTVLTPPSVAGNVTALEGQGPVLLADIGPVTGNLVTAEPLTGCTPLTNAAQISGNIALISRGTCSFLIKYQQAQAAGARAIVVYNTPPVPPAADAPLTMIGLDNTVTIPGMAIPFAAGNRLSTTAGVTVKMEVSPDPTLDDRIATFSSRGPGGKDSLFKPDISAPGVAIVSTAVGTGNAGGLNQGTSMATPHVAGAAAILKQLHPKLGPKGIKALLQNATVNSNPAGDTRLTMQGVGALRVDRAAALSSFAAPGGVSFGRLNPLLPTWQVEKIQLHNLKNDWRHYRGKHVPNRTLAGVEVSCPSNIAVLGKRPATAFISLKFDPRETWDAGIADNALASQTEVDGWCVFSDGKDELRVGYIAVVDAASSLFVTQNFGGKRNTVTVRNLGPSLGWAEGFTLAKLGGEQLNGETHAISAVGFRRGDPALYGLNVLEFGIATERKFTTLSKLIFDFLIDTNADGTPDVELLALDLFLLNPNAAPGTFVTAQINATGQLFLDWQVVSWDYNDRTAILPFTLVSDEGLLPEKFNYELFVFSLGEDGEDVQHGSVDLGQAIVPDVNSFGVEPKDKVDVTLSGGKGTMLWLFQNNILPAQVGLSVAK